MSAALLLALGCTAANPEYAGTATLGHPDAAVPDAPDQRQPDGPVGDRSAGLDDGANRAVDTGMADSPSDSSDSREGAGEAPTDSERAVPPSEGLLAHWALDEGLGTRAGDLTGNQNEGALTNGAQWLGEGAPIGRPNASALRLDGTDDFVELVIRTLPRAEAPKTIGVWFRNSAAAPRLRNLVALYSDQDTTGIHLGFEDARVAVWRFGDFDPIVRSAEAPDGAWHHLGYSWDGAQHRLYLDGDLVGTSDATVGGGAIRTARLGAWELPDEMFGGDLDEVRVYGRVLTDAEITALAGR